MLYYSLRVSFSISQLTLCLTELMKDLSDYRFSLVAAYIRNVVKNNNPSRKNLTLHRNQIFRTVRLSLMLVTRNSQTDLKFFA